MPATSYSTGGGGTVLEHRYGAFVLAHLLSGAPLPELDGLAAPVSVRFQAGAESAVDDLVVRGIRPDGAERAVAVAARRNPQVIQSSDDTRALIGNYLRVLDEHFEDVRTGAWRIGLASSVTSAHAVELTDLSAAARQHGDAESFRAALPNRALRNRLSQLDLLIADALAELSLQTVLAASMDVAWWLLRALHVRLLRLEGGEQSDWISAVTLLVPLTSGGSTNEAAVAMDRIAVLVGDYSPAGAEVNDRRVRSDLGDLLSTDVWVDGFSRRVTREPEILRYLSVVSSKLMAIRRVSRSSLGLSEPQVDRSFNREPPIPADLAALQLGEVTVVSGPIGSGKTDTALRWLLDGRPVGTDAWGHPVPVFLRAEHLQSTLDVAIEAEIGFAGALDRFGVDVVVDGLDERPGASPITLAQEFVKAHPKCRVVITAREGELVPKLVPVIRMDEWSLDDVRELVGAVLEREPWRVGHDWTPEFFEAARRPLFALLAAAHSGDGHGTGASLVDLAVRDALARVSVRSGLEELALATVRAGRAVDPHTVSGISAEQVRASPLLEFDGPRVRFVLPIFEQWFAAQAVLGGSVDATEFITDEPGFARWRYVLAIALSGGTWETTFPWLDRLVRANPAAGAWVVREAVRTDLRATSTTASVSDTTDLPEQIWAAMSAWVAGLDWASPYLGPGFTLGTTAPGTLDGVRLAVTVEKDRHITVAWLQRKTEEEPTVRRDLPAGDELRHMPQRTSWGPAPNSEIWPWSHTLEHMDRKALEALLTDGQFLALACPPSGIVRAEFDSWFTVHALGFNDIWPARVTSEMALEKVTELLVKVRSSGEKQIKIRQFVASEDWLESLRLRVEAEGDIPIRDVWPDPDLSAPIGGARAYSDTRALERANAVYAGAAQAYEEIRTRFFPRFGKLLGHAATFPAVLEGHFESGMGGPWGGDLGSASIDYWMRPVRGGSQDVPLTPGLRWGRAEGGLRAASSDEAFELFMQRRRDDPLGSAFELTSVQNAIVHNEFWGRRPATHLAVEWLLQDLANFGWVDGRPAWVQLK